MNKKARVIAMYLPQYQPLEINNLWWGKGFTEWTNVGKAKPLFRGHYQPRVPADLGYYDLRLPIIREQQAELAREAGVEGFMYWHYWFGNGKMVMQNIMEEVLESGKPDFPFCFGWANHSWTNTQWNSANPYMKEKGVLAQTYPGDEDYIQHFNYCLKFFKDPRYITVEGKPFFLVFNPTAIPDTKHFIELWNKLAIENGLKGIHFIGLVSGWEKDYDKAFDLGYDAIAPQNRWYAETKISGSFKKIIANKLRKIVPHLMMLNKYEYKDIIKYLFNEHDRLENAYPIILPNFDRSPRAGRLAQIYDNSTPELFKEHVKTALEYINDKSDEHKILILQSWNEWAEGNYMEPDLKYGHGYIEALKDAIK